MPSISLPSLASIGSIFGGTAAAAGTTAATTAAAAGTGAAIAGGAAGSAAIGGLSAADAAAIASTTIAGAGLARSLMTRAPRPQRAPPAPDPLDPAVLNAQRQRMAAMSATGGGRASTILQDNQNYQSQQL